MIKLENISKKYGEQTVLDSFSLSIKSGEKIAFVGASGQGKTTLLHIAAGLVEADGGKVSVSGRIAIMFQEPRLLPWKNAIENISAILKKENSHLAQKYLDTVGLSNARDKFPHELSGGMAQRVAFARFLAFAEETDADLLLLDEPFSALDSDTADSMMTLLEKLSQGKTLLLVTHNKEHAKKLEAEIIRL